MKAEARGRCPHWGRQKPDRVRFIERWKNTSIEKILNELKGLIYHRIMRKQYDNGCRVDQSIYAGVDQTCCRCASQRLQPSRGDTLSLSRISKTHRQMEKNSLLFSSDFDMMTL